MDTDLLITEKFWHDVSSVAMGEGGDLPDVSNVAGCVFFQTSGSMGKPKWVALSKDALLISAAAVNEYLGVTGDSCWGLALPLRHVGGFGVVARAYQAGCRLERFQSRWDARAFAEWIDAEKITHTSLVPTQVHDVVAAQLRAPESLKAIVVGGGRLSDQIGGEARALGWPVLASYGMTEACSQIATQGLEALNEAYCSAPIPVLPHWQVAVNEAGLLKVAGQALLSGVIVQEEGDWIYQERAGEWLTTSDRVKLSGGLLTPLGRADLQVKVLGELVDLEQVERELVEVSDGAIPADSLVVVALPDERQESVLVPVLDAVLDRGAVEKVIEQYDALAPGYRRLLPPQFLEDFPRSDLGKPLREECKKRVM